jgi:hypothetical protein
MVRDIFDAGHLFYVHMSPLLSLDLPFLSGAHEMINHPLLLREHNWRLEGVLRL